MTNKKCQLTLGQKVHGPVTMDMFKMIGRFFYAFPKWVFYTKIYNLKKKEFQ